jgi:YidC/Oxa1 family membrane protein insertase
MDLWTSFVGLLYATLLALSQLYGGSMGAAILTLSLTVRLALLPLSVRASRRALSRQAALARLRPEADRLRKRFEKKPARLAEELRALYERHNVRPLDPGALGSLLLQFPLFLGLYSAIGRGLVRGGRFLWIHDIAKPDVLLAALTAGLSWMIALMSPAPHDQSRLLPVLTCVVMFVVVSRLAAGLGLYIAASNSVSLLQSWIVRRLGPSPA